MRYPVSTIFILSGVPLLLIDWLVSDGTLFILGAIILFFSLCFIVVETIQLRIKSPIESKKWTFIQIIKIIFTLTIWGLFFIPYHELIHYIIALVIPNAIPVRILWQSYELRPVTHIRWLKADESFYIQKVLVTIAPLIVGLALMILLWPITKKFTSEINEEFGYSYFLLIILILGSQLFLIIAGSVNDLFIIIEFLRTYLSVKPFDEMIIESSVLLIIVGIVCVVLFLISWVFSKKIIEPQIISKEILISF